MRRQPMKSLVCVYDLYDLGDYSTAQIFLREISCREARDELLRGHTFTDIRNSDVAAVFSSQLGLPIKAGNGWLPWFPEMGDTFIVGHLSAPLPTGCKRHLPRGITCTWYRFRA